MVSWKKPRGLQPPLAVDLKNLGRFPFLFQKSENVPVFPKDRLQLKSRLSNGF